jgi:ABC-type multidrug transport system ATPase subunit
VLPNGTRLLDGVTFSLESRALLGVVGPSGSGKSTLLKALTGFDPATTGEVRYGDQSLYDDYDALRRRIGYVPQDDVVHPELTVRRALEFAADLRFPADVGVEERRARVSEVIEELGLGERADVRVDRLSGGQRKRVSVALELLTGPSLLFLDEPTSGLDPNYERTLMELFRGLADGGRTVVVVTHSTQSLRLCDRVLVLAPGGRLAYFGPPQLLLAYFDREDMPDVFRDLADRADVDWGAAFREHEYHDEYVERTAAREAAAAAVIEEAPPARAVPRRIVVRGRGRQFSTLLRRNAAVLTADRRNLALVLAQAPLLGLLMLLALPGDELAPAPSSEFRLISQASLILLVIVLGVSWLGMSNAIGAIAKEMPIYRRDRAAGVSITAYLAAKVVVLGVVTVAQAVVLVALATAGQGGPRGAVLFGLPLLELMVAASLTGLAAMTAGLFLSALLRTPERASSVLPIVLVFLLILALGGVFPEIGTKPGLKQLGYVASTQWGFAQMASTTDLNDLQSVTGVLTRVPSVNVDDPSELFEAFNRGAPGDARWDHTATAWIGDAAALCGLALLWLLGAGLALRRLDRQQRRRS